MTRVEQIASDDIFTTSFQNAKQPMKMHAFMNKSQMSSQRLAELTWILVHFVSAVKMELP